MDEKRTCKCCGNIKPLDEFYKNRVGYTFDCKECVANKHKENKSRRDELNVLRKEVEEKRRLALADFHPRELMKELKRRGFEFKMTYTEVRTIDSKDL